MSELAFLKDYNPAGRLVFAVVPGRSFLEMFEHIVEVTGRKIPNILVSMFYLRGSSGGEKLRRVRAMCDRLFIDSGVFSFRSKILSEEGMFFKAAYWTLSEDAKNKILEAGLRNKSYFDDFADEYRRFLITYGDVIDVAIDLDVDQFLGLPIAEQYYQSMLEVFPAEKIMRVWHSHGRDWGEWKEWCSSGKYKWLSLEGPDQHKRNVDMYNRFIDYAHQYGIKVHVLAVTTLQFMFQVALDTCDSSTYTVGGRYARLIMPDGRNILIGKGYKAIYENSFDRLPPSEREKVVKMMKYFGLTPEELTDDHMARCLFNTLVFLVFYDKELRLQASTTTLF